MWGFNKTFRREKEKKKEEKKSRKAESKLKGGADRERKGENETKK